MILVFLVIVILATAVLGVVWRRKWTAPARRPRKRSLLTRIICGTLAAAILIAIAVGTWRQVRSCYADPGEKLVVRVPAMPAPPLSTTEEGHTPIDQARILFHLIVVEAPAVPVPVGEGVYYADRTSAAAERRIPAKPVSILHVEELEVHWPQDKDRTREIAFVISGTRVEYSLVIRDLYVSLGVAEQSRLMVEGDVTVRQAWLGNSRRSGQYGDFQIARPYRWDLEHSSARNPLSVVPVQRNMRLVCMGTPLANDDPLKQVTPSEFEEMFKDRIREPLAGGADDRALARRLRDRADVPVTGLALLAHTGLSALLLLVAAVLLTQLFRQRGLAFAGVLAGLVLYVAVLDRLAVSAHLSRMEDETASVATRIIACQQAAETFFYGDTALERIASAGAEPAAPPQLREHAQAIAAVLGQLRADEADSRKYWK